MRHLVFALLLSACGPTVTEVPVAPEPPAAAAVATVFANAKGEPICPVMGEVTPADKATSSATYEGVTYYFCCDACTEQFAANPAKYAKGSFLVDEGMMSEGAAHEACGH